MRIITKNHLKLALGAGVSMLALYNIQQAKVQTQNKTVYHGSDKKLDSLAPRYNERWSHPIRTWYGHGVFATDDRRIALIYTNTKNLYTGTNSESECFQGVDLINMTAKNEPLTLMIFGGKTKEDALDQLYDDSSPGYIYHLNSEGFSREEGLGKMEVVSRNTPSTQKVEIINRRAEITKYVEQGLMKIDWQPGYSNKMAAHVSSKLNSSP